MKVGLHQASSVRGWSSGKKYPYIVQKFGGESVDETEKVFAMLEHDEGSKKLAVVSAFSKVTDSLFAILKARKSEQIEVSDFDPVIDRSLARLRSSNEALAARIRVEILGVVGEVVNEVNQLPSQASVTREDLVIGLGERIAARVVAAHCNLLDNNQSKYVAVDLSDIARGDLEIDPSDSNWQPKFFSAIKPRLVARIKPLIDAGKIPVITGYMGRLPGGTMKVMDRGYSDSTLMLIADALAATLLIEQKVRADVCKTVIGVLSADPKAFDRKTVGMRRGEILTDDYKPSLRPVLTKKTVARLAATGMKAVNAVAADILEKASNVDALVRHTFYPRATSFTVILDRLPSSAPAGLKVIAHKPQHRLLIQNTSQLNQTGWIAKLLDIIATEQVSVNVVDSTDNTCTILVDKDASKLEKIKEALQLLGNITELSTVGWITCAEDGKRDIDDSNADFQRALAELYRNRIKVIRSTATAGREITLMVPEKHMVHAVRYLHQTVISRS
jgi:aspartokinase